MPGSVTRGQGTLTLTSGTAVTLDAASEVVGRHFAARLARGTGWKPAVAPNGQIKFKVVPDPGASPESYILQITAAGIDLRATTAQGIARGAETLLQLMPTAVYGTHQFEAIELPVITIKDSPQFAWRGLLLDVSRRFQSKETVLKLLDGMAASKLNVFHWHLTDDQGWRLPIAGYPRLTADAGNSYSREDVRGIVEHAAKLGITIMPEIDMPGHSNASCQAYPEISTPNDKGKPTGTINPGADATYVFVETVIADVVKQFPNSPYIHIGADEVGSGGWGKDPQCQALMARENLKSAHDLQTYFVNRVVGIVSKNGRKVFAWDEAFNAKSAPDLAIMSWRGMPPGIAAAKAGHQVVFCPTPQIYLDHPNSRSIKNPPAYSANVSYLNHCYFFNPGLSAVSADKRHLVLGGQACLWSERVTSADHMFTMMFPRACAIGESLWMRRDQLDWEGFLSRLAVQQQRLDAMNIPYFRETESLAVNIGSWKETDITSTPVTLDFPLDGKFTHGGVQEFFVAQGTCDGQFLISSMELLKDGTVLDTDRHEYEASVYKDAKSLYLLKTPDAAGGQVLRIHVKQLTGKCSATVQMIPALAPDQYSKQCAPESESNRTKQSGK